MFNLAQFNTANFNQSISLVGLVAIAVLGRASILRSRKESASMKVLDQKTNIDSASDTIGLKVRYSRTTIGSSAQKISIRG